MAARWRDDDGSKNVPRRGRGPGHAPGWTRHGGSQPIRSSRSATWNQPAWFAGEPGTAWDTLLPEGGNVTGHILGPVVALALVGGCSAAGGGNAVANGGHTGSGGSGAGAAGGSAGAAGGGGTGGLVLGTGGTGGTAGTGATSGQGGRVEQLRLHGLTEPAADGAALEEGWPPRGREHGRLGGLAEPAEVAADAIGGDDEGAQFHPAAALAAVLDVDFERPHRKLAPGAITRAAGGRLVLLAGARRARIGVAVLLRRWWRRHDARRM